MKTEPDSSDTQDKFNWEANDVKWTKPPTTAARLARKIKKTPPKGK